MHIDQVIDLELRLKIGGFNEKFAFRKAKALSMIEGKLKDAL